MSQADSILKAELRNLRSSAFLFICRSPRLPAPPHAKSELAEYFPSEMNVTTPDAQPTFVAANLPCIA
jgi:hypothetical protein